MHNESESVSGAQLAAYKVQTYIMYIACKCEENMETSSYSTGSCFDEAVLLLYTHVICSQIRVGITCCVVMHICAYVFVAPLQKYVLILPIYDFSVCMCVCVHACLFRADVQCQPKPDDITFPFPSPSASAPRPFPLPLHTLYITRLYATP